MSPAASQTTYLVKLKDRRQVAERTMAFQFEKPEGFTFTAGQSIDMTLMNPSETDGKGMDVHFPSRVPLMKVCSWSRPGCAIRLSSG